MSDTVDDAALVEKEDADFASGFTDESPKGKKKPDEKPAKTEAEAKPAKPEAAAAPAKATEAAPEKPEYVQINAKEWAEVRAAAAKTASYDQQLSKAFGTIGNLQKLVTGLQGQTPAGRKVEIPKDAFADMERDFPELAAKTKDALEKALAGVSGTGAKSDVDASKIEEMLATHTSKREIEALEDSYPDWRDIVGAVDVRTQQPDPNNAFRKWLAGKDVAYQVRINGSESAAVIGRAIRLFQNETKAAAAKATPAAARADRIRAAVQPKGDNAGAAPDKSDDDEFMAGFNSR